MSDFLEKQRTGCAFGAYYTALAIENVLPISHSGPGCVNQAKNFIGAKNGGQGPWKFSEALIPCTNFTENDVVFGAIDKLKTTIKHTLDIFDADMLVVLSGCTSEIIGENIEEALEEYRDAATPIVAAEVSGFKGNNIYGHEQILKAIIEQYVKPTHTINPKQVNVWGIIPFFDPFWDGTYNAIEETLKAVGLEPNIIYGKGRGLKHVDKIPSAAFNLVLSPWWDVETAKLLEEKFNTPYFQYPYLPVGPTETTKFLRALSEYAKLDTKLVEDYIAKGEEDYYYFLNRSLNWYYDSHNAPKRFISITNSNYALALSKHLVNDLGFVPDTVYITDGVKEDYQEAIKEQFRTFDGGITAEVVFTKDGGRPQLEITEKRRLNPLTERPYILGTFWDEVWAKEIRSPFLPVSMPLGERIILNKHYFGYKGGLTFFEDFFTSLA